MKKKQQQQQGEEEEPDGVGVVVEMAKLKIVGYIQLQTFLDEVKLIYLRSHTATVANVAIIAAGCHTNALRVTIYVYITRSVSV